MISVLKIVGNTNSAYEDHRIRRFQQTDTVSLQYIMLEI